MSKMTIDQIKEILPHRYPFLFLDFVEEITENSIVAVKNCTVNEPFFQGHFPDYPIMPGVLQIEAMAQASGILIKKRFMSELPSDVIPLFLGIDKARFKQEIRPGDVLKFEVKLEEQRETIFFVSGKVTQDGKVCTKARLMLGFKDN